MNCWCCDQDCGVLDGDVGNCINCGVDIDRTPYITMETLQREGKVIPETKKQISEFAPWLIGKESPVEIEKGLRITVTSEWTAPNNPKISYFLFGECEFNGEKYTHGINSTTYFGIAKAYGKDTADWVGKKLEYQGKVKMGSKGTLGHSWIPVV